jgi:hypothetical protein
VSHAALVTCLLCGITLAALIEQISLFRFDLGSLPMLGVALGAIVLGGFFARRSGACPNDPMVRSSHQRITRPPTPERFNARRFRSIVSASKEPTMKTSRCLLACALLVAAGASYAEIFRCQSREGVTYQEVPCPAKAIADTVNIAAGSYPDYVAARDRLAARESAMDARLLRRLEIESAERIARDNRAAMEAQAERDRIAQQAAQASPLYIVPFAMRAPRHPPRRAWPASIR